MKLDGEQLKNVKGVVHF